MNSSPVKPKSRSGGGEATQAASGEASDASGSHRPGQLHGDAAYREALRVRFEVQKEALEMRLKQEREAVEKSGAVGSDKTLALIASLAQAYRDFARFEDEKKHLEELLEAARDLKGPTHPATVSATMKLALCSSRLDDHKRSVELLEALRPKLPEIYPKMAEAPQICAVLLQLANAYQMTGQIDEQVDCLTKVVEAHDQIGIFSPEDRASTINKLACAYGMLPDGTTLQIQLLEERLPWMIKQLTRKNANVFSAWMQLALAYGNQGKREDQLGIYDSLMGQIDDVLGNDIHPLALALRRNRAVAMIVAKRNMEEALAELTDILSSMTAVLVDGTCNPDTLLTLHALADGLARAGRWQDSVNAFDELLRRMTLGYDDDGTVEQSQGYVRVKEQRDRAAARLQAATTAAADKPMDRSSPEPRPA